MDGLRKGRKNVTAPAFLIMLQNGILRSSSPLKRVRVFLDGPPLAHQRLEDKDGCLNLAAAMCGKFFICSTICCLMENGLM